MCIMRIPRIVASTIFLVLSVGGAFSASETNSLGISVRELSPQERSVKNTHELWVTITNRSAESVQDLAFSQYLVTMVKFDGQFIKEVLMPTIVTNRPRIATSAPRFHTIAPHSSFCERVRLEELLRLGRDIPQGYYWVFLVRKCGSSWEQIVAADPIQIRIE